MNAHHRDGAAVIESNDFPDPMHSRRVATPGKPPRLGALTFVAMLVLAAIFVVGLLPRLRDRAIVHQDAKELSMPTVGVLSPAPAKAAAPLALSGEMKPVAETALFARVPGYVKSWTADIGTKVKAGDVLAELDTPEISQDLAKARAELAQAESAEKLSAITTKRWQEMLKARTVSSQEADEKAADLTVKSATVNAAAATVQRLEEWVGYSKITAPFDGIVTERHLDVGQLISTDVKEELYRIAQIDKLRVFVRVPQNYARTAKVGLTVDLTVPELPGRKFPATIVRTAGAIDPASRTLLTELEVDNSKGELFAGSYGQVRLTGGQADAILTLPANTLLFRAEGTLVAAITPDNHVTMRHVELGRDFGSIVEVLSGITASDRIVMNPPDALVEGMEVRVAQAKPTEPAKH